jgi:hypothetical protein
LSQHEMIRIFVPIVDIHGGSFGAGNREHGLRDVNGHNGGKVAGKFLRQNAGATTNVQRPLATFGKMLQEKGGSSLPRGNKVILFGEGIERLGVVGVQDGIGFRGLVCWLNSVQARLQIQAWV